MVPAVSMVFNSSTVPPGELQHSLLRCGTSHAVCFKQTHFIQKSAPGTWATQKPGLWSGSIKWLPHKLPTPHRVLSEAARQASWVLATHHPTGIQGQAQKGIKHRQAIQSGEPNTAVTVLRWVSASPSTHTYGLTGHAVRPLQPADRGRESLDLVHGKVPLSVVIPDKSGDLLHCT